VRAGLGIVLILTAFAWVLPVFSSFDPNASDFEHGISSNESPLAPSALHWLGTDRIFRDELVRLAVGGRLSLLIGLGATAIATAIGALVGIVAGFFEGSVLDVVLMRIVDVILAFPFLLLVMTLGVVFERTTPLTILLTLGLTGWLGTARIVRAKTIAIRGLDFVEASRALGQSTFRTMLLHILPNVSPLLLVLGTMSVAQMIIAESVLSYLGAGISPPTPTWGHMLFEGQDYYQAAPWILLCPAVTILITVMGFNLLGEGLRDAIEPKR
jgi:ABC-type dipeptide/oligopeptide/nickel transport system permease subunit